MYFLALRAESSRKQWHSSNHEHTKHHILVSNFIPQEKGPRLTTEMGDCKAWTGREDTVSLGQPVALESKEVCAHVQTQTNRGMPKGTQEPKSSQ